MNKYLILTLSLLIFDLSAGQNLYERNRDVIKPKCKNERKCSQSTIHSGPQDIDQSADDTD